MASFSVRQFISSTTGKEARDSMNAHIEAKLSAIIKTQTEKAARDEWREVQEESDSALYDYRFNHVNEVVNVAGHIARSVGADTEVITLAGWLHDMAKPGMGNVKRHGEASAKMARNLLEEHGVDKQVVDRVCDTIRKHVGLVLDEPVEPLEAQVLWDADKLVKLGVIGLIHFLANGLKLNPGFELREVAKEIRDFIQLAERIVESMNTQMGKEMAQQRLNTLQFISDSLDRELQLDRIQ
ncbi:MAG: HD domain-containing protein [Candidatus Thorarchaeota archaeon]